VTQLIEKAERRTAWEFLQRMLSAAPYRVHASFADNGVRFAKQPRNRTAIHSL
jgi:hypothetical protein